MLSLYFCYNSDLCTAVSSLRRRRPTLKKEEYIDPDAASGHHLGCFCFRYNLNFNCTVSHLFVPDKFSARRGTMMCYGDQTISANRSHGLRLSRAFLIHLPWLAPLTIIRVHEQPTSRSLCLCASFYAHYIPSARCFRFPYISFFSYFFFIFSFFFCAKRLSDALLRGHDLPASLFTPSHSCGGTIPSYLARI